MQYRKLITERASWDDRLTRYPTLPVTDCVGFETSPPAGEEDLVPHPRRG